MTVLPQPPPEFARSITRTLTNHALTPTLPALALLYTVIPNGEGALWFARALKEKGCEDGIVRETDVQMVMKREGNTGREQLTLLRVIDAYDMKTKWKFHEAKGTFLNCGAPTICSNPLMKSDMYRDRYKIIKQRLLRHPYFKRLDEAGSGVKLPLIKSRKRQRHGTRYVFLGMLSQLKEGSYFLEDLTDRVELDLSKMNIRTGFFTETCFVLCEGVSLEDGTFLVEQIAQPPAEERKTTIEVFGHIDFLSVRKSAHSLEYLREREAQSNNSFVFLSDVHLNSPRVMEKLHTVFTGFAGVSLPVAFILMGDFLSEPMLPEGQSSNRYRECWIQLTDLLLQFPILVKNCHFIFVPGPNDPWSSDILPRPGIPKYYTAKMRSKLPHVTFASNPCRLKFCTQEIVIYREDLLGKLIRNSAMTYNVEAEADPRAHLLTSVLSQGHLCPLPLGVRPIYWAYDHTMTLYPLPDVLVLTDGQSPNATMRDGCVCLNPGSFPSTNANDDYFPFVVYTSHNRKGIISAV